MMQRAIPDLTRVANDGERDRVNLTVSCRDSDEMPRVLDAGGFVSLDGREMQVMHNGILVEKDGYGGPWTTEIIRALRGVHEPQEEPAFDAVIRRLARESGPHRMIEFGSYWAYYSIWFARDVADASVIAMEPDAEHLEVGRRNAVANGVESRIEFVRGVIGPNPHEMADFVNESDGQSVLVEQFDLDSLMALKSWESVDLLLIDIQGAETELLSRARPRLKKGDVRFVVVSTHHVSISGDALTHQKVLEILLATGGHIVAEHSVQESFSGDGLVVAAYRDPDLNVPVSYARSRDSLFGELEWTLGHSLGDGDKLRREADRLRVDNGVLEERLKTLIERLRVIEASLPWKLSAPLRAAYRLARGRR